MQLSIQQSTATPPFMAGFKRCPRCPSRGRDEWHSLRDFGVCRARKDGLNLYCKRCIREKINTSRIALREYKKLRQRAVQNASPVILKPRTIARILRRGSPVERVKEAIHLGAHTQREIARVTKLSKDDVCDAIAELLLWTREIRVQTIHHNREYFIVEEQQVEKAAKDRVSPSFASIKPLMPNRTSAHQRRKAA
jgi:hypothetical protein